MNRVLHNTNSEEESNLQDLMAILWFLARFVFWVFLVGMLAWGAGALMRWISRR